MSGVARVPDQPSTVILSPAVRTVRNPGEEMGALAFERLRHSIDGEGSAAAMATKWTLPTTLVERASVRDLGGDDGSA